MKRGNWFCVLLALVYFTGLFLFFKGTNSKKIYIPDESEKANMNNTVLTVAKGPKSEKRGIDIALGSTGEHRYGAKPVQSFEGSADGYPDRAVSSEISSILGHAYMDALPREAEEENDSNERIAYSKKHILVKFLPEEAGQIDRGNMPKMQGRILRKASKGGIYEVIPVNGESVEELVNKYNTEFSDMIQYAQLDYVCEATFLDQDIDISGIPENPSSSFGESRESMDNDGFVTKISIDESPVDNTSSTVIEQANADPDQNRKLMWYLDKINIEEAWLHTKGRESVIIALLDTGVAFEDYEVPGNELSTVQSNIYKKAPGFENTHFWTNPAEKSMNMIDDDVNGYVDDVHGYDFVNRDGHPNDNSGHGTHLASIMVQNTYNPSSSNGIAPNCTLMNLKVLDYRGRGYSSNIAEAIYYAVDHGADVINLSLAWPPGLDPGPVIHDAVLYAAEAGVIMIGGSGNNSSKNAICYPAAYNEIIAIGATQYDNTRAYYSNYGSGLEFMVPGGNILEDQDMDGYPDGIFQEILNPRYKYSVSGETLADPENFSFEFVQGTSMATAEVTGIVALMLSIDPDLSLENIRIILRQTATFIGPFNQYGYGLINVGKAISRYINGDFKKFLPVFSANNPDYKEPEDKDMDGCISSSIGGVDCNDYDPAIYPGAIEIPYDGIDQDCDGIDLTDVDGDGYDAIVAGGTDCNDNDLTIYPWAPEIESDGIDQDCDGKDLRSVENKPCTHPDCLNDIEIESECIEACMDEYEIELECD